MKVRYYIDALKNVRIVGDEVVVTLKGLDVMKASFGPPKIHEDWKEIVTGRQLNEIVASLSSIWAKVVAMVRKSLDSIELGLSEDSPTVSPPEKIEPAFDMPPSAYPAEVI